MEITKKRRLKYGATALALTLGVTVTLILLQGIIERRGWRFDWTANRELSLSEQTREVLQTLEPEVRIIAFFRQGEDLDDIFIRRKVNDILKEYAARSPKISYRLVNPDVEIDQTVQHQVTLDGTVLFLSGKNRKEIYKSQLFDYSRMSEAALPEFSGEGLFTNAILKVTQSRSPLVCLLEGHGERDSGDTSPEGFSQASLFLQNNNYQVRGFSFVSDPRVPKDCDLLVIAGRQKRLDPREERQIEKFLNEEKPLLLLEEPLTEAVPELIYRRLQIRPEEDVVLDPERHFLLGPHFPAPLLTDHPITSGLKRLNPILSISRSLAKTSPEAPAQPLLTTSEKGWGETDLREGGEPRFDAGTDLKGPLTLGWALEKGEKNSRAVVVGDADFACNGLIEAPGNLDLFLNIIGWLVEEKGQLTIRPKTPDFRNLSLSPERVRFIALFTQAGYPLLVLVTGGLYWFKRKRR